ncbi:hypothetical protein ACFXPR_22110 [Nocardia tengchongensis]
MSIAAAVTAALHMIERYRTPVSWFSRATAGWDTGRLFLRRPQPRNAR